MKLKLIIGFVLFASSLLAQQSTIFKGQILDKNTLEPLPYANVVVQNTQNGTISNEQGLFSVQLNHSSLEDTLVISFIGYQTQKIACQTLDTFKLVYLQEDLINLSETFVFGEMPDARLIIKRMVENREKNYLPRCKKTQAFVRRRMNTNIPDFSLEMKKNSFDDFNPELLKEIESKVPENILGYEDFLGDLYFSNRQEDSLKIDATKFIILEQDEIEFSDPLNAAFTKMFAKLNEKEYWKIKSGVFSQRAEINNTDSTVVDTIKTEDVSYQQDSRSMAESIQRYFDFTKLEDNENWSFLYETDDYEYKIESGTRIAGEDVYIIDFEPKKSGEFQGRLYVGMASYALIRADFKYAEGKEGFGIKLFGIGYRKANVSGSILFEKRDATYQPKYFAYSTTSQFSIKRPIALVKKRKRLLWDKTLQKIKVQLKAKAEVKVSQEVFVLNNESISHDSWSAFKPKEKINAEYVNEFSDDNWKGYSIIEPTQLMRQYKKPAE